MELKIPNSQVFTIVQGSVLCSVIFIIVINDLPFVVQSVCKMNAHENQLSTVSNENEHNRLLDVVDEIYNN